MKQYLSDLQKRKEQYKLKIMIVNVNKNEISIDEMYNLKLVGRKLCLVYRQSSKKSFLRILKYDTINYFRKGYDIIMDF